MAAIRVLSLPSSLTLIASTSYSCTTKLRRTSCLSFFSSSFCCNRGNRMAHSIPRATLGLTNPAQIDPLQVLYFLLFIYNYQLFVESLNSYLLILFINLLAFILNMRSINK